jgi:hypothetical protein
VKVKLDQAAAAHMKSDGQLEVQFELNDIEFAELREALRKTFREHQYFTEAPAV